MDNAVQQKWQLELSKLRIRITLSSSTRICSNHFSQNDFYIGPNGTRYLLGNSIPSISTTADCSTPAQECSSMSSTPSLTSLQSTSKISTVSPNEEYMQLLADFEAIVMPDSSEKTSINTTKRKIDEQPAFIEISRKK